MPNQESNAGIEFHKKLITLTFAFMYLLTPCKSIQKTKFPLLFARDRWTLPCLNNQECLK